MEWMFQRNTIVSACSDGAIRVFDSTTGLMRVAMHGHNGSVDHLHYDGDVIVSVGSDR